MKIMFRMKKNICKILAFLMVAAVIPISNLNVSASIGDENIISASNETDNSQAESKDMGTVAFENSISGMLWVDINEDSIYDAGEQSLADYPVYLYLEYDMENPIRVAMTDEEGRYEFAGLEPETYIVGVKTQILAGVEYLLPAFRLEELQNGDCFRAATDDTAEEQEWTYSLPIPLEAETFATDMNAGMRIAVESMELGDGNTDNYESDTTESTVEKSNKIDFMNEASTEEEIIKEENIIGFAEPIQPFNTITVGTEATLANALNTAQDGDTIRISTDMIMLSDTLSVSAIGDRTIYISGVSSSIIQSAPEKRHMVIEGNGTINLVFSSVIFDGGSTGGGIQTGTQQAAPEVMIEGAIIQNCDARYSDPTQNGGAIHQMNGSLRLINATLVSNTANDGGGLYKNADSVLFITSIEGGSIRGNTATHRGGGSMVYTRNTLGEADTGFYGVTISENKAAAGGGGINIRNVLSELGVDRYDCQIIDCLITENTVSQGNGGGVESELIAGRSAHTVTCGTTISGNRALNGNGGGVYCGFGNHSFSENTQLIGNHAVMGGGAAFWNTTVVSFDSTSVVQNTAEKEGGGIYISASVIQLGRASTNILITGNSAGSNGGGMYIGGSTSLDMYEAEISDNTSGGDGGGIFHENIRRINAFPSASGNTSSFFGNKASESYDGPLPNSPGLSSLANVAARVSRVTEPFTHPFNNYDISLPVYTISFDANAGIFGVPPDPIRDHVEATVIIPSPGIMTYFGHHFAGWNTQPNGQGISYQEGEYHTLESDLVLYAQWAPDGETIEYRTITYDGNGNTGGTVAGPFSYPFNSIVRTLNQGSLFKTGYIFAGWCTESDGSGKWIAENSTFSIWEDLNLYAVWVPEDTGYWTLTYFRNTDSYIGLPPDSYQQYHNYAGTGMIISGRGTIENPGHTFYGWNTEPDGSGELYVPGDRIILNADTNLYAQWRPISGDDWQVTVRHRNTAEEALAPNQTFVIDHGERFEVLPLDLSTQGYEADYYIIVGWGETYDFKEHPFTSEVYYNVTITIYYTSTMIQMSVPTKLLFAAFASGGGDVVSPNYRITNQSAFPIQVSLTEFSPDSLAGLQLVQGMPVNDGELRLDFLGGEGFNSITGLPIASTVAEGYLGRLEAAGSTAETVEFTIGGFYKGDFGISKSPVFKAVFTFELVPPVP